MASEHVSPDTDPELFTDTRTLDQKLTATLENWRPSQEPEQPNPLTGLVIDIAAAASDYSDQMIPIIRVLDKDGVEWRIMGYHAFLRRELQTNGPRIGDRMGILYKGEGTAKENQAAPHLYKVVVERNPAGAQPPDPELDLSPVGPDDDIPF